MEQMTVGGGKGTLELRTDGVLHLVWNPGTVLEAADVQEAMATINEVADGTEYPTLIDITNTQVMTRRAKAVFSTKCAASRIALIGSSPVCRVIANFAMARRTLPCPTRVFNFRHEALDWLLQETQAWRRHRATSETTLFTTTFRQGLEAPPAVVGPGQSPGRGPGLLALGPRLYHAGFSA